MLATSVMAKLEIEVQVQNKLGLHARPAAEFVRAARGFKSSVRIRKEGNVYSAASILDVLTANLDCGASFILEAEGTDAHAALEHLKALLLAFKAQD